MAASEEKKAIATIRAFLAVDLTVPVARRLAELIDKLRQDLEKGRFGRAAKGEEPERGRRNWRVAWVPATNLHLSMKFFGEIAPDLSEVIGGVMAKVGNQHTP